MESTTTTLRHRHTGAADGKDKGIPTLEPLPRSPPTAGGKRLEGGEDAVVMDAGATPSTANTTPATSPPPPGDGAAVELSPSASFSEEGGSSATAKLLALSRAFSSYPGEVITAPVTGPAKVDMEQIYPNPNPLVQLVDFLVLFLIVRGWLWLWHKSNWVGFGPLRAEQL